MQTRNPMIVATLALAVASAFAQQKQDKKPETTAAQAEIGKAAPDFELKGYDGKTRKLSDYKDKIVVLEWINLRCPVSDGARPFMKKTAEKYAEKGVVWLAIDSTWNNKPDDYVTYTEEKKISCPVLMDPEGDVGHLYGARTTPHMFIINKGTLAYMGAHDNRGDRNYVAETLDALLAGTEVPLAQTKSYGCSVKYNPRHK